jgi:hypothetical protein
MMSSITKYSNSFMTLLLLAIFTTMVAISSRYPPGARFMTFVIGFPGIAICVLQLFLDARERRLSKIADERSDLEKAEEKLSSLVGHKVHFDVGHLLLPEAELDPREQVRREFIAWGYFLGFIAGIILFGFHIAVPVFLIAFLRLRAKASWRMTLGLTAGACVILFVAFEKVLRVSLHTGFITDYFLG